MASKRKKSSQLEEPNYENDDGNVISKRQKITIISDSSSNESHHNINAHDTDYVSKYIRITEDEYCDQRESIQFVEEPGPKCPLPRNAKPIEYFNLFFNNSLWEMMVKETNRYADELLISSTISDKSRMAKWYPVTVLEMKAFVAVLLEMGITRKPTLYSYWVENSRTIPWFKKMFSRNRFQNLLKCFHLIDNKECFPPGHEKYDACAKFNPIAEHASNVFKKYYTPHKELFIDESLVGTLSHSSIVQHSLNKKHHKWGIKFWMLCDAVTKYCISFYCYRGEKSKISQNGLGYDVVEKLLKDADCLNKGHHLYVDNYFTSTALAKFLFSKNTYITGTIKRNGKDIPNEAKEIKVGEIKYFQNKEVFLCAYREKQTSKNPVLLITTKAADEMIVKKRCGKERQKIKPQILVSYNNFMGAVDESDKMVSTYLDERRTLQYWKKVTFNIFSRMVLNSYLLYKETVGKSAISRLQYTSDIISEIEQEWAQDKKDQFDLTDSKACALEKLPGRNLRRCVVCSSKNKTVRRSSLICAVCKKGLHPLCLDKHLCMFK